MLALISHSWITNKVPSMTKAATEKNWNLLDRLFKKAFISSNIFFILSSALILVTLNFTSYFDITSRILSIGNFFVMIIIVFFNHQISCMVTHLRSYKKEPLVWILFSGSLTTFVIGYFIVKNYSVNELLILIIFIQFFYIMPFSIYMWKKINSHIRSK